MIRVLRSFMCILCFFLFGLGSLFIGSLLFPLICIIFNQSSYRAICAYIIRLSWKIFVYIIQITGMISIRNNTKTLNKLHGKIVIANHPSLIDVIILVSLIPKSICVVKQSLFKNAFVKNIINKVYLSNDMQPKDFFATASQILDRGYNIVIFPEGTRTIQDTPIHLHNGFAYLHIFSKHDIQPIHIDNCPQILGKNQSWYDVSTKTSRYTLTELPPIKYKHNNKTLRKQVREISDFIKNTLFNV